MDTKALRQKVLDLAIRGKLVPQDPEDEPAIVLLEKIRVEKQQMVKDGKLKPKDVKNDTVIFRGEDNLHYEKFQDGTVKCIEDEIPFEVPEGWEWTRLQSITSILTDGTHKTPQYSDSGYIFLSSKNVTSGKIDWNNIMYIPASLHQELYTRLSPKLGDILLAKNGTTGIAAIVDKNEIFDIYVSLALVRIVENIINPNYILNTIGSSYVQDYFDSSLKGIGVPNLHLEHIRKTLIPIPPYNEQNQINLRTNILLSLIEKISIKNVELQNLVAITKSKILNLAICGKLVPQDPNDEPASLLLDRIRAEKEELIKQGKIKRDKKESIIFKGEDNSYYRDIPKNWAITSLNELTTPLTLNDGNWILSKNMSATGEVKLIQLGSIGNMHYIDKGFKYLNDETFYELSCTQIYPGYMLINRIISDKMCACILPEIKGKLITTVDTCWIAPNEMNYNLKYILYTVSSPIFQKEVLMNASGTTRKRISKNKLISLPLLLPPLAEQHRIVEAIETAFAQLNNIVNLIA